MLSFDKKNIAKRSSTAEKLFSSESSSELVKDANSSKIEIKFAKTSQIINMAI